MSNPLEDLKSSLIENPWSDELSDEWNVIKHGDWMDCHKAESKEDIIKHLPTGRLFEASFYRTGDHWQGYETELSSVHEVEPYKVVVIKYRAVETPEPAAPAMCKPKVAK